MIALLLTGRTEQDGLLQKQAEWTAGMNGRQEVSNNTSYIEVQVVVVWSTRYRMKPHTSLFHNTHTHTHLLEEHVDPCRLSRMARMLQHRDSGRVGGGKDGLFVILVLPFQQGLGADDVPGPDAREEIRQGSRDVLRRRTRRGGPRHALQYCT